MHKVPLFIQLTNLLIVSIIFMKNFWKQNLYWISSIGSSPISSYTYCNEVLNSLINRPNQPWNKCEMRISENTSETFLDYPSYNFTPLLKYFSRCHCYKFNSVLILQIFEWKPYLTNFSTAWMGWCYWGISEVMAYFFN